MHLLVHDFAGHPFQVQLSRELAARGHVVKHVYPLGLQGPKGRLAPDGADPSNLSILGIALSGGFRKYSPLRRFIAHRRYSRDLKRVISESKCDAVLSGNTPIDVQAELLWHCRSHGISFVHWVQDMYGLALHFFLQRKVGVLAGAMSYPFRRLDKAVAFRSDANVVISPDFQEILNSWGVPPAKTNVIENWAPLDEIRPLGRVNTWSDAHSLSDKTVFLYSGTLGMKHRPDLLYLLAKSLDPNSTVVVITEGVGRDYLNAMPKLDNLVLLNFQEYAQLPKILASADVLLATIEADAGVFAVPSKVLTYLCAGRPLMLASPINNLASAVVKRSGAGFTIDPDNSNEWVESARRIALNLSLRQTLGANARAYAESAFDMSRIGSEFEEILLNAISNPAKRQHVLTRPRINKL